MFILVTTQKISSAGGRHSLTAGDAVWVNSAQVIKITPTRDEAGKFYGSELSFNGGIAQLKVMNDAKTLADLFNTK